MIVVRRGRDPVGEQSPIFQHLEETRREKAAFLRRGGPSRPRIQFIWQVLLSTYLQIIVPTCAPSSASAVAGHVPVYDLNLSCQPRLVQ